MNYVKSELARNLVSQSQVDVRRSVWDLRSRALEEFDLPGALSNSDDEPARNCLDQFKLPSN